MERKNSRAGAVTTTFNNHPYGSPLDDCNQRTRHWHWGKLSSQDLFSALELRIIGCIVHAHAAGELGMDARGRETIDCG